MRTSVTLKMIRLVTALIPVKRVRRRLRDRWMAAARERRLGRELPVVRARYAAHETACREKLARGERLRVAFLVCDASMFSAEPVFAKMKGDPRFDCFIAVVPRVTRGDAFLRDTLKKTTDILSSRYSEVCSLYNPDTKVAQSLEGRAEVVFTSIVYDDQTLEQYTAFPLSRFALVACIPYGYGGHLSIDLRRMVFLPQVVLFWRLFVTSRETLELWKAANPLLEYNLAVGGYPKMDRLAEIPVRKNRPTTIIISPHHTLARGEGKLSLSNFLRYADFFLRLPGEFPQVQFVFRPHPLLFPRLATSEWWGEKRANAYREEMAALPNVEFQQGGDYLDVFVNSDAMIHDCGSFLAEYFYTGHPQCYILSDKSVIDKEFTEFGKRLHRHVVHAFSEDDIRDFVRRVVAQPAAIYTEDDAAFADSNVCMFHPHAADSVVEQIARELS